MSGLFIFDRKSSGMFTATIGKGSALKLDTTNGYPYFSKAAEVTDLTIATLLEDVVGTDAAPVAGAVCLAGPIIDALGTATIGTAVTAGATDGSYADVATGGYASGVALEAATAALFSMMQMTVPDKKQA